MKVSPTRAGIVCLLATGFVSALSGCTHNLGTCTLVATKNVDLTNFNTAPGEEGKPVKGNYSRFGTYTTIEEAIDNAVEPVGATALTNARLSVGGFLFWSWADASGHATRLK